MPGPENMLQAAGEVRYLPEDKLSIAKTNGLIAGIQGVDMKLARYIYFTKKVGEMVAFYRDILGMKVLDSPKAMDYDKADWVQLGTRSFEIGIHRASKEGSQGRNRNKLVFAVKSVSESREKLASLGVRMGKHHVAREYESCDFKDPDGNVLQISSR
jgi:catechol 2,3-dioxygenase-like lactoylglutathione lyase family enzyme